MMDIPEFYILGLPIETELGNFNFLLVKEYPDYFIDLQVVSMSKLQIIYKYMELNKDGSLNGFLNQLNNLSLFEIVFAIPELTESYVKVIDKMVDSDSNPLEKLNSENFNYYRKLILTMNCIKEEVINPNPEIQRAIERSKRVKAQDGEPLEFSDLVSSVVGFNGLSYKDINEFTIFQLYHTFYRIAQIKNFDVSCLFATVSTEKIKIDSWSKHINLFEEENHAIEKDKFEKQANGLLS